MSAVIKESKELWIQCDACKEEVFVSSRYDTYGVIDTIDSYSFNNGWRSLGTREDKRVNICPTCIKKYSKHTYIHELPKGDSFTQKDDRQMNEIETKFAEAILTECNVPSFEDLPDEDEHLLALCEAQKPIVIYIVDFYMEDCEGNKFVVEIDGHESHKTKQQRYEDYCRERVLQKQLITVIRFTGSEVFVDAERCAKECLEIIDAFALYTSGIQIRSYEAGQRCASKSA